MTNIDMKKTVTVFFNVLYMISTTPYRHSKESGLVKNTFCCKVSLPTIKNEKSKKGLPNKGKIVEFYKIFYNKLTKRNMKYNMLLHQ